MKNKFIILFIFFLFCIYPIIEYGASLNNQQNIENLTDYDGNDTTTIKTENPFLVKFDVARLLPDTWGMRYGCICFGFEKNFRKNSIGVDIGYITDYGESKGNGIGNISAKNVNGYYSNIEYRIYRKLSENYNFYYGINLSYQKTKAEREELNGFNRYLVNREVFATHIKAGIRMRMNHFVFDPEIGCGTRYIKSKTNNKIDSPEGISELPYNKLYESGDKLFPSINFNLKIGWLF